MAFKPTKIPPRRKGAMEKNLEMKLKQIRKGVPRGKRKR